jgi:hypothetical protein
VRGDARDLARGLARVARALPFMHESMPAGYLRVRDALEALEGRAVLRREEAVDRLRPQAPGLSDAQVRLLCT